MKERETKTALALMIESQSFIDAYERALNADSLRLEFRRPRLPEFSPKLCALINDGRQLFVELGDAVRRIVQAAPRPSRMQFGQEAVKHHSVLSAERLEGLRCAQGGSGVAPNDFEKCFPIQRFDQRRRVTQLGATTGRPIDQLARPFNLAQLPACQGEAAHRHRAGVVAIAFQRFLIARWVQASSPLSPCVRASAKLPE